MSAPAAPKGFIAITSAYQEATEKIYIYVESITIVYAKTSNINGVQTDVTTIGVGEKAYQVTETLAEVISAIENAYNQSSDIGNNGGGGGGGNSNNA